MKIGTRPSKLAVRQAQEIKDLLPSVNVKIVTIQTKGDIDKKTPLSGMIDGDFFTKELEGALLSGRIDAAVHSAKDVEENTPGGLIIAFMTESISQYECLVSRKGCSLKDLPGGAIVGTSSAKRKDAVLRYRSDLVVEDIRGDIEERLARLDRGDFDAIIVAHAALIRLGLGYRINQIIPEDIIEPHPLQGRLAVQIRKDRKDLVKIFRSIDARQKR